MKDAFINKSINIIKTYNTSISNDDYERIKYGLEGIYLTVTKLILIIVLSIIFGIFKQLLLVLFFFNIIRFPAFGVHADKSIICLIVSTLLILGLTYLLFNISLSKTAIFIVSFISYINYPFYAPADTIKRPLTNAKKRKYRKIASCCIALIYMIISLTFNNWVGKAIFISLILEAIMINPLTYKILGMPFNNYKKIV